LSHRKRIADSKRDGSARGRRQIEHARFFLHPRIERNVGVSTERGVDVTYYSDGADSETFEMVQQRNELIRFTTF
jgi:hypothetical protein